MLEKTKLNFYRFLSAILLVVMLSMSGVMYVSAHGGGGLADYPGLSNSILQAFGAGSDLEGEYWEVTAYNNSDDELPVPFFAICAHSAP